MLNPLDHFVQEQLRCGAYVRYADDFLLFSDDKDSLHAARETVRDFLRGHRLRLHRRKSVIFPVHCGIPFLGYRVFPTHRLLARPNTIRLRRRLRKLQRQNERGSVSSEDVRRRVISWWGHAQHANAWRIARQILADYPFLRAKNQWGQRLPYRYSAPRLPARRRKKG